MSFLIALALTLVATWTDWVHNARNYIPKLNEAGLAALEELGDTK